MQIHAIIIEFFCIIHMIRQIDKYISILELILIMRNRLQKSGNSIKLSDVAAHAGVSTATVSRTLNSPAKVSAAVAGRVRDAIDELGYVPDAAARALASRRSRTIGALVPTLSNPIFADCIQAMEERLEGQGYALVVASTDYTLDKELRQARALLEHGVDALLLTGSAHDDKLYQILEDHAVPYVNTWAGGTNDGHPFVGIDNIEAARRLTGYLLDLGHRHLGMIAGISAENDRVRDRIAGVRRALDAKGLTLDPKHLIEKPYGIEHGREAMRDLLRQNPAPSAIIGGNDLLALGALLECQAQGLNVPKDISIAGFDDIDLAGHISPALTTMRVPTATMGRQAADYLLQRLSGDQATCEKTLDVELIVRASTAPCHG